MYVDEVKLQYFWKKIRHHFLDTYATKTEVRAADENIQDQIGEKPTSATGTIWQNISSKAQTFSIKTYIPSSSWNGGRTGSAAAQNLKSTDVPFVDIRPWDESQYTAHGVTSAMTQAQLIQYNRIAYAISQDGTMKFYIIDSTGQGQSFSPPSIDIAVIIKVIR